MLYITSIANTYGMIKSFVLFFHTKIIWILSKKVSFKYGGIISVKGSLVIIYLNWFPVMDTFNHIGSPSKMAIGLQIKSHDVSCIISDEEP